jgi:hypothetical protein
MGKNKDTVRNLAGERWTGTSGEKFDDNAYSAHNGFYGGTLCKKALHKWP